jgi:hypothetical protein
MQLEKERTVLVINIVHSLFSSDSKPLILSFVSVGDARISCARATSTSLQHMLDRQRLPLHDQEYEGKVANKPTRVW